MNHKAKDTKKKSHKYIQNTLYVCLYEIVKEQTSLIEKKKNKIYITKCPKVLKEFLLSFGKYT